MAVRNRSGHRVFARGRRRQSLRWKQRHLYALTLDGGKEVWKSAQMRTITASPLAGDSIVCIQTFYGATQAFDIKTGKGLWTANLGGSLQSTPIVTPEAVYLATYQGVVYALR
jgi:outer membrane protein assembly factor BamB